jgi:hypothetical protein
VTDREARDLELLQGHAVLFQLHPVPGDLAVAVGGHRKILLIRQPTYHSDSVARI